MGVSRATRAGEIMVKLAIGLLASMVCASAVAQQVITVDVATSQAQVRRDENGFSACGVRVLALKAEGAASYFYDFSLMFYVEHSRGFAKFGIGKMPSAAVLNGSAELKAAVPPPTGFWIARVDQAKAARPVKYLPAEDAGYTLGFLDGGPALQAIDDIVSGATMHFNIRYKNDRFDQVNQFSAPLPKEDAPSYYACLKGIEERLRQ